MEENNLQVIPEFRDELTANITQLGEITSNIEKIRNYAINLNNFFSKIVYTEEHLSEAKYSKAKINKIKKSISDYRKNIEKEFNKPLEEFKNISKEVEEILDETYANINNQVNKYEHLKKLDREKELKEYFEEYKTFTDIKFVKFEDIKLNITLSASMTKLRENIKDFLDNVKKDIELIMLQEYSEEILYEYKNNLNVSEAITTVLNRKEKLKYIKQTSNKVINDNNEMNISDHLSKPIKEIDENEEIKQVTFTLRGTMEQLIKLKQFIELNNIEIIK